MSSPRSPERRKILASINPPHIHHNKGGRGSRRSDYRDNDVSTHPSVSEFGPGKADMSPTTDARDAAPRVTKFRFKSSSSRSHRSSSSRHRQNRVADEPSDSQHQPRRCRSRSRSPEPSGSTSHRVRDSARNGKRRHHRHRRKYRSRSPKEKGKPQDDDPFASAPLSPDTAFRESLFDAMADDEGAAYWEGVYGQPIHIYTSTRTGPQGELERMTDEEYAAYVRQKMWEKTHAGLIEERARQEREREERRKREAEARRLTEEMERSLRRGEERRRRKRWGDVWDKYLQRWNGWDGQVEGIPWPASDGTGERIDEEGVKAFFVDGLGREELGDSDFAARLKEERVRWHPDKMQQRLGGQGQVDATIMKKVTEIFQVVDRLWNDTRKSS